MDKIHHSSAASPQLWQ